MTKYRPIPAAPSREAPKPNPKDAAANRMGATFDVGDSRDSMGSPDTETTNQSEQGLAGLKKLQDPSKYEKARFSFRLYKR